MNEQPTYIYGAAAHAWLADGMPPDLKPQLQAAWGKRFRRINHFIELTLIGAKSCLDQSQVAIQADCDVYLASEQGNVADVADITELLFKKLEPPMPLAFLNISNNMAGFYLAQSLNLQSSNLTIAHQAFPFETALDIATFNMANSHKAAPCALVGGVEECAYPLDQHRQRMNLATDTPLAEGSSWLHMGANRKEKALARCEWVKFFPGEATLISFLKQKELAPSTYLAGGYNISDAVLDEFTSALNINKHYDCRHSIPFHDTHCAYTVASFIMESWGHCLVHINRDKRGRYAAICISRV